MCSLTAEKETNFNSPTVLYVLYEVPSVQDKMEFYKSLYASMGSFILEFYESLYTSMVKFFVCANLDILICFPRKFQIILF